MADQANLDARLARARQLLTDARFEAAAEALDSLLAERPDFLQARYEWGVAHYHLGRLDAAIEAFAAVAAINSAGLQSDEFYHALQALPAHQALAVLHPLLPKLSASLKLIEGYGRILRRAAAAANLPHSDIEVIGDSHAVSNFSSISRCRVHWLGPRTMYRITREPLDLAAIGVAPGARIVTVFGEIDCRCHLISKAREMGTTAAALAQSLADAFVRSLQQTAEQGRATQMAIAAIVPPQRAFTNDPAYPTFGSSAERRDAAMSLNRALADAGRRAGIGFLELGAAYYGADGYLDPTQSDGHVHIDFRLTAPIAESLDAMFGPAARRR